MRFLSYPETQSVPQIPLCAAFRWNRRFLKQQAAFCGTRFDLGAVEKQSSDRLLLLLSVTRHTKAHIPQCGIGCIESARQRALLAP